MVPGNLPSQLEILSTGQTYYETVSDKLIIMTLCALLHVISLVDRPRHVKFFLFRFLWTTMINTQT